MSGNTILSNGIRQNLLSLQQVSESQQKTQLRLATGKRVNSALDNPVNFFTSDSLNSRANILAGLLDGISNATKTIEAADKGIKGITTLVQQMQSTVRQALNDAASNRPTGASSAAYANAAEVVATGKTLKQISEDKLLWDADASSSATAATSGSVGDLGLANTVNTVEISVGGTATTAPARTYRFSISATTTVRDLVNGINTSGIATAAVDETGNLRITGTGSDGLRVRVGTAAAGDTSGNTGLGLAAATWWTATGITSSATSALRTGLIGQFNDIRAQIGKLGEDSGYNGINLLVGNQLQVIFNERTGTSRNTLDIQGYRVTATDFGIATAATSTGVGQINFQNDNELNTAMESLTNVLTSLRTMASTLGSNLSIVQTRQEFTKGIINALQTGADNLVLADQNEEGAKLLALNTRQQLSQTALSLSSQAEQGVLRLFG
jgi:flagellin